MGYTLIRCDGEEPESKRRKRRVGGKTRQLPDDVMIEILLSLPVRSLVRFYCVCKSWRDLILSPSFISMYNSISRKVKVSFYRREWIYKSRSNISSTISFSVHNMYLALTVPGFTHWVDIVGCSNGLVCLSLSKRQDIFLVWNPATRQFRHIPWLPNDYFLSNESGFSSGFFSDPIANNFKLTRIAFFTPHVSNCLEVDVFSSTENAWISEKRLVVPAHPTCRRCCSKFDVICVDRCMYWLVANVYPDCDCRKLSDSKYILCFDMVDELFKRIELPSCRGDFCYSKLVAYKESMAMFVRRRSVFSLQGHAFDLWVMSDCSGTTPPSWSKQLTITPCVDATFADGFIGKEGYTRWVVLRTNRRDIYLMNPENGETREIFGGVPGKLFLYSESLVPVC